MEARVEEVIKKRETIPYPTIYQDNPRLLMGLVLNQQEGQSGEKEKVFRIILQEGREVKRILLEERILAEPIPRIVSRGTAGSKITQKVVEKFNVLKTLVMKATAYSRYDKGCNDITATGRRARRGVVAVDPRVIRLGTKVYVEGYGHAIAADTGGAIKGQRIDLCFNTVREAKKFGRQKVKVHILE
jgi:3D (Asp-Asp-Asp) domain-containing protein